MTFISFRLLINLFMLAIPAQDGELLRISRNAPQNPLLPTRRRPSSTSAKRLKVFSLRKPLRDYPVVECSSKITPLYYCHSHGQKCGIEPVRTSLPSGEIDVSCILCSRKIRTSRSIQAPKISLNCSQTYGPRIWP